MSGERLRWNPDEIDRLHKAALPLLIADAKLSVVEAVRRVQDVVLPSERRRNLVNVGLVPVELRTRLQAARDAATGDAKTVPAEVHADAVRRAEIAEKTAADLISEKRGLQDQVDALSVENARLALAAAQVPTPYETIQKFCADVLADALARDRAISGPHPEGIRLPPDLVAGAPGARHDPEPKREEKPRVPKVLLCGLKPDQRAYFESAFNGRVNLRFFYSEDGGTGTHRLEEKAKNADMVYLMMGAVNHAAVAIVAKTGVPFQRVATYSKEQQKGMIESWLAKWQTPVGRPA